MVNMMKLFGYGRLDRCSWPSLQKCCHSQHYATVSKIRWQKCKYLYWWLMSQCVPTALQLCGLFDLFSSSTEAFASDLFITFLNSLFRIWNGKPKILFISSFSFSISSFFVACFYFNNLIKSRLNDCFVIFVVYAISQAFYRSENELSMRLKSSRVVFHCNSLVRMLRYNDYWLCISFKV